MIPGISHFEHSYRFIEVPLGACNSEAEWTRFVHNNIMRLN